MADVQLLTHDLEIIH